MVLSWYSISVSKTFWGGVLQNSQLDKSAGVPGPETCLM